MSTIERFDSGPRMSQAVVHANTVYLAGQVAHGALGESVMSQTKDILTHIDALLAAAGSDKSKALSATIWLANMDSFKEMNAVWDGWIDPQNPPARACVEARLAAPGFTVEIALIAAIS